MKRYIIMIIILFTIIFGILTGIYFYKINNIDKNIENIQIASDEEIEDECTAEYEYLEQIKTTNAQVEKVSPNAKIVTKIYYDGCGHTVKDTSVIQPKYINLTEEEFAKDYKDWEFEKFSNDEIILKKSENGICNEHYVVKETDGYVTIYSLDENEKETLQDITDIPTQFLSMTDVAKLQGGIRAYGKENLYRVLEDFE